MPEMTPKNHVSTHFFLAQKQVIGFNHIRTSRYKNVLHLDKLNEIYGTLPGLCQREGGKEKENLNRKFKVFGGGVLVPIAH